MKSTKRLSQSQRRRKSLRRHDHSRPAESRLMEARKKPGVTFKRDEIIEDRRSTNRVLQIFRKKKSKPIVVPQHTFGNPQSEEFWQDTSKTGLLEYAKERNIKGRSKMTRDELVAALVAHERGERD